MLVLHPSNSTLTDNDGGRVIAVGVFDDTTSGVLVDGTNGVLLGIALAVATIRVALLAPMITGVGECIDGVLVGGKNGVGGL